MHTRLQRRLRLRSTNCGVLWLVVCKRQDRGCGFVVVAVLSPCLFAFFKFLSVCNEWTRRLHFDCMDTAPAELSSPLRQSRTRRAWDTRGVGSEVRLCLSNYFCITNGYLPSLVFAVCSSCQNRSLVLCIVSSVNVINRLTQLTPSAVFGRRAGRLPSPVCLPLSG